MWLASALVFQTNVLCKPSSSSSTEVEGRILFWSPAEAASGGSFLFTWTKDKISISKSSETAEINFLNKLLLPNFASVTYTKKSRATSLALDPFICLQTEFHCEWNYPFNLHQNTSHTSMVHVITRYSESDRECFWQMDVSEL